jgi:hypothetical protein
MSSRSTKTSRLRDRVVNGARGFRSGRSFVATVALSVGALRPGDAAAQATDGVPACADVRRLRAEPAVPAAGTLFLLRTPGDGAPVLAAAPIDSVSGVTVRLACRSPSGTADTMLRVTTRPGAYRQERLRVAPRFSAPPDSALAARMADEARRSAEVSRQSRATPPLWRGPFAAPRPGRITSPFGSGRVFNGAVVSRHMGLDYAGAVGTPVRAIGRGVVRLVDRFHLGGNVIYLDHGAGLVSAYLHLSRHDVAVGDTVARGGVIGRTGATGRVTGPHLHLIVRLDSVSVDPRSVVGKSLGRPETQNASP